MEDQPTTAGQPDGGQAQAPVPPVALRYDEIWLSSLFRPLLITLLIGCIDVAIVGFLRHILPGMPIVHSSILVILAVGSAFIGGYTTTLLIRPEQRERRTTGYRLAELALILLIVRIALWAVIDGWPAPAQIIYQPFSALLSGAFIVAAILVLISWGAAVTVTGQFLEMALRPDELAERLPDRYRAIYDSRLRSDRGSLLNRFSEFWILGGVLLLLLTSASQFGPGENGFFALARQSIAPAVIGAGVLYFLTGLILIAIGRLAVLRAQWQIEEVTASESISRNWPVYVIVLIAIMGGLAFLLPLGGTFWLAQILVGLLQAVYFLIYMLFAFLLSGLMGLFSGEGEEALPPPAPAAPPPIVEQTASPAAIPPWLGGTLFWILMALLLGYAAYIYLSGKGVTFTWLQNFLQRLRASWLLLWQSYSQWRATTVSAGGDAENETQTPAWRLPFSWLRLAGMNANQQLRYFYLSMLKEGSEQGVARRPGETPSNYAGRLEQVVEDPEKPVSELTESFVQLHFAGRTVEESALPRLKERWQRIQQRLQRIQDDEPRPNGG